MATGPSVPVSTEIKVGYQKEILVNKMNIDDKFLCNFCFLVLRDPVQALCGHRFCRNCLASRFSTVQVLCCPQCERESLETGNNEMDEESWLVHDKLFPDNAIKREMARLDVVCVNQDCSWKGIFRDYEKHDQECEFRWVLCDQCGSANIQWKYQERHKLFECPKKKIQCDICTKFISQDVMEDHKSSCSKMIQCPIAGCGQFQCSDEVNHFVTKHLSMMVNQLMLQMQNFSVLQNEGTRTLQELNSRVNTKIVNVESTIELLDGQIAELTSRVPFSASLQTVSDSNIDLRIQQTVAEQTLSINDRLEINVGSFEGTASSLHTILDKTITAIEKLNHNRQDMHQIQEQNTAKISSLERGLVVKDLGISELQAKVLALDNISYDGTLLWKVSEFKKKQADAIQGQNVNIVSPPFYTSHYGYKMCVRIYPTGDGSGKGTHLSVFFVLMRGTYDALLRWPFRQRVVFTLMNQLGKDNMIDSFCPDQQSSSFQKPTTDMNIASGCPQFITLDLLNKATGFLKDDTLFLKVSVDTNDI